MTEMLDFELHLCESLFCQLNFNKEYILLNTPIRRIWLYISILDQEKSDVWNITQVDMLWHFQNFSIYSTQEGKFF